VLGEASLYSVRDHFWHTYGKVRFKVRSALGLIHEHHRVTVIASGHDQPAGVWSEMIGPNDPRWKYEYAVRCESCGQLGSYDDSREALDAAFAHSPYVDRGLFHRSRLHYEKVARSRSR
jgi:hypothetical protein